MDERLYKLLEDCTVKLSIPGKKVHATGFFVAPGLILTCVHVVKDRDNEALSVFWLSQNQDFRAIVQKLPEDPKKFDLVLLKVQDPFPQHPCVYLDESVQPGDELYSYGYPKDYPNGAPVRFKCEGLTGEPQLIKFQAGQVQEGLSGAPLLNCRTGKVCGMIKETRDYRFDLGGGAVPTKVIFSQLPELESKNHSFHEQQKDWIGLLNLQTDVDVGDAEEIQQLNDSDLDILEDLIKRSGLARTNLSRRALCQRITINPDELDFLEQIAAKDFARLLIDYLVNREDILALLKLCQEIKPNLKGSLSSKLKDIEDKIKSIN